MIKDTILPLAIFLIFLVGCGSGNQTLKEGNKPGLQTSGIAGNSDSLWKTDYSLLREARKITAYRLNPADKPDASDKTIAGFKVIGEGCELSDQQCNTLQFIVLSPLSYNHKNSVYKKLFLPSVAYAFSRGGDVIYLLEDLSTDEWALANGEGLLQHQFTYSRRELLQLAKDIYPNDEYFDYLIKNINDNEK